MSKQSEIVNAMSIDVEDYFQVYAFEKIIDRNHWKDYPLRVEENCEKILRLLDQHRVKATFFVLGWVAERCPTLIKKIVTNGHELASHGYMHQQVFKMNEKSFLEDIVKTKKILEDLGGVEVRGYRAPSYSIGEENFWALDLLQQAGYRYSSSIYPIRHDIYGMPDAPRFGFYPLARNKILEVPVTTFQWGNKNFPCGGGGYFRLLPYRLSRWAIRRVNRMDQEAAVFYFHPWEIDPDQPRQRPISLKTRFRHYVNMGKMYAKLDRLLTDFHWDRMDKVFLEKKSNQQIWSPIQYRQIRHAD